MEADLNWLVTEADSCAMEERQEGRPHVSLPGRELGCDSYALTTLQAPYNSLPSTGASSREQDDQLFSATNCDNVTPAATKRSTINTGHFRETEEP